MGGGGSPPIPYTWNTFIGHVDVAAEEEDDVVHHLAHVGRIFHKGTEERDLHTPRVSIMSFLKFFLFEIPVSLTIIMSALSLKLKKT